METKFKQTFYDLLKNESRIYNEESKEFNLSLLKDFIDKLDVDLLKLLLSNKDSREFFFKKIDEIYVLKQNELKFFLDDNKLDNSYTQYLKEIGLSIGKRLLTERNEVVLDWPFKDCVLEGGMTKEEQKRKEIFFNQVLARDEIDRLEEKKVLINWKRYSQDGEKEVLKIKRGVNGIIRENLIIKGNNLLALHSIKHEFNGEIKLIYIDPPYNIGKDSFGYNDNFNHSTWLTFMKNRLEVAYQLLKKDGAIFIQIDLHELGYLLVLMDEIFGKENRVQVIAVKTASPAGFKTINPGPIDVTEYILFYTKDKKSFNFKRNYVGVDYDENYSLYIENIDDEPDDWRLIPLYEVIYKQNGIEIGKSPQASANNAKRIWGEYWKIIRYQLMGKFALENSGRIVSVRDPHKPSNRLKEALSKSKETPNKVISFQKYSEDEELNEDEKQVSYLYNGGALSFYSNKVMSIDGIRTSTILLTDFWDDLSWDGIAKEGGVKLKNGKKPERLIKRIIEMAMDENDIILDFFLGSGTTAAVAHKLGHQYIGIEQLDYGDDDSYTRLKNVVDGDQTGISKSIDWKGGGDILYFELAKWNELAKEKILLATSLDELKILFHELYSKYFLNYNVKIKEFFEVTIEKEGFKNLNFIDQKNLFIEMLDMNQMYVNFSERLDKKYSILNQDLLLSEQFYGSNL